MDSNGLKALKETLRELCHLILAKLESCRANEGITVIPYQFVPTRNIDFSSNSYTLDYSRIQFYDHYHWTSGQYARFRESIEALPEYEVAKHEVIKTFELEEKAQDIGLSMFVRAYIHSIPNEESPEANIESWISLFINSFVTFLSKGKSKWSVEAWLEGITLDVDEVELMPGVFLKRPNEANFDKREQKKYYIHEEEFIFGKTMKSSVMLVFTFETSENYFPKAYPDEIDSELECYINILRLYWPNSVNIVSKSVSPYSVFSHGWTMAETPYTPSYISGRVSHVDIARYNVNLTADNVLTLSTFAKHMYPILSGHSVEAYFLGTSYDLALHRYNDALLNSDMKPYQVISAMSCLEALLSDGSPGISKKVRERTGELLSKVGFDKNVVTDNIKTAYSLRSKIVHGADASETTQLMEFIRKNCYRVVNYTRICLVLLLQLRNTMSKTGMCNLLDVASADVNAEQQLQSMIDTDTHIPTAVDV